MKDPRPRSYAFNQVVQVVIQSGCSGLQLKMKVIVPCMFVVREVVEIDTSRDSLLLFVVCFMSSRLNKKFMGKILMPLFRASGHQLKLKLMPS